jgi:hypothetical protein
LNGDGHKKAQKMKRCICIFLIAAGFAQASLINSALEIDPVAGPAIDAVIKGTQPLDSIALDRPISSWNEIGLTYMDAVRLNSAVTSTSDALWTGWATTGDLMPDNTIFLTAGETLESPVQTGGIARYAVTASSDAGGTGYSVAIFAGTNQVFAPYQGSNGVLRITCGSTMPGQTPGLTVHPVQITGYSNAAEAEEPKTVSGLRVIEEPADEGSVTPKWYVDAQDAAVRAYGDARLAAYGADTLKVVYGTQLRLNRNWNQIWAGSRWILSAGEVAGNGTLSGVDDVMTFAVNDYPLLEIKPEATGVAVEKNFLIESDGSNDVITLQVLTNGVISAPFAEYAGDLRAGAWVRVADYLTNSYPATVGTNYVMQFSVPAALSGFVRVMQPDGASEMRVKAEELVMNAAPITGASLVVFTNGWSIQCTTNGLEFVAP